MIKTYSLTEKLWLYPGKAGWFFITVPPEITKDIEYYFSHDKRGWGSLPVKVSIGQTSWSTSIFPQKSTQSFLLPIKAEVRKKEHLQEQQLVTLTIELSD